MGYESKLYVVDKHDWKKFINEKWGEVIAMFDLCGVPRLNFSSYPATDCYIVADDGNTEIKEDRYGDPLKEVPIQDAIEMIERVIEKEEYYRRYKPCLDLLKGFNINDWENLIVLHYGH